MGASCQEAPRDGRGISENRIAEALARVLYSAAAGTSAAAAGAATAR